MRCIAFILLLACAAAQTGLDDEYADMVAKRHALVDHSGDPWDFFREAWPCPTTRRYGTLADGGKWLCYLRSGCTVLSLGVSNEFSFEAELHASHNCTVHGYDPTIESSPEVLRAMRFHHVGVRGESVGAPINASHSLSVREMLHQLNLAHVDILKVDVEGAEFGMFADLFADYAGHPLPFDQLLVEFHLRPMTTHTVDELRNVVEQLEERGFRIFESELNSYPGSYLCCAELAFVHKDAYAREFRVWQLIAQAVNDHHGK